MTNGNTALDSASLQTFCKSLVVDLPRLQVTNVHGLVSVIASSDPEHSSALHDVVEQLRAHVGAGPAKSFKAGYGVVGYSFRVSTDLHETRDNLSMALAARDVSHSTEIVDGAVVVTLSAHAAEHLAGVLAGLAR